MRRYRNKIKKKIKAVAKKSIDDKTTMLSSIVDEYKDLLKSSKISGLSLKYVTYSTLEGADEVLDEKNENKEKTFTILCSMMSQTAYEMIQSNIENIRSSSAKEKQILEKIYTHKANLEEIADAFKEYILENGYDNILFLAQDIETRADNIRVDTANDKG